MYFKRLELLGFKSFCDKTVLNFEPGITAVVGPNGCGKSNIFDSIRWVLGEQSAKSLRGSDMQDVIFNGTDKKEPVGMAEVTLAFDNEKRFFNIDNAELAITRRLFRSGESEYLLNKAPVRLKDILDLLLGTGIGAESYSIVAQGKIDLVLSSRPEDRRVVFDEASGITKYKSQKRETMRRLEETEQNLLRVNDIVTEVKRQIGSLERQANKARKYKEVFEELKQKETILSSLEKKVYLENKNQILEQIQLSEGEERTLLSALLEDEAKISNRQTELKAMEENIMGLRNIIMNLENVSVRNSQHIKFNQERIQELSASRKYLEEQLEQAQAKLLNDEEKLKEVKNEYDAIRQNIEEKIKVESEKELLLNNLALSIRNSLDSITYTKKVIIDLAGSISQAKNQISEIGARQQVYLARGKRLDIEKAKVYEERTIVQESLNNITQALEKLRNEINQTNNKINVVKCDSETEVISLSDINSRIVKLEKQRMTLESHKEFLQKLKSEYEEIGESMNAVVYLDKVPAEKISGLMIKIKDCLSLNDEDKVYFNSENFKLSGEAKPMELDTQKIEERILKLIEDLAVLENEKTSKESRIDDFNKSLAILQQELRNQEISLANNETSRLTILEQFNKIKEEEDIIFLETSDVGRELGVIENNLLICHSQLSDLNKELKVKEDSIFQDEANITKNSKAREEILVMITQIKAELDALNNRISSDEATIKILQGTYNQDSESVGNIGKQLMEAENKEESLGMEITDCKNKILESENQTTNHKSLLSESEIKYKDVSQGSSETIKKIDAQKKEVDAIKNKLYELQMQAKDMDYKYASIKERMSQAYKIDLDSVSDLAQDGDSISIIDEIEKLKDRLDSYGTVNLVAIEEYDELKKRYDFLIQQQNDLFSAKESLHQAILKINRTTKQMFLETFEKVREEFRNYFKLLFNGGDAQLFLIDEQDPLESGIEIICRPPGKKLQNVLLLSGGEKSMSAIALIFAIFKVKPSPFCILDEIDAALDEANVDRFSRMLQEFIKTSQFIVITHNKKTIVNADVMYGITMQESGVSKIVSVKFGKDSLKKDEQPEIAVSEPV